MKPILLSFCAVFLMATVVGVALHQGPRRVRLPVYEKEVRFFEEGKQALTLASLPEPISSLSAEACASCHKEEYAEWKQSAHARSVTEPVFAAAFNAEPRFLCRCFLRPGCGSDPPISLSPPACSPFSWSPQRLQTGYAATLRSLWCPTYCIFIAKNACVRMM
jgi:cytochrome c554/c'-like protein